MMIEYPPDALRFEGGRPVAVGEQPLAEPTRAVRTEAGFWGLFATGDDVVVVHPAGAISGHSGDVRERLERMAGHGGLGADDREAVASFLPFLGGDDPGAAEGAPRSRVQRGLPPTYWLSGTKNSPG